MSRFHTTSPAQLEKDLERTVPQKPVVGQVTLTANAASTTLSSNALRPTSKVTLTATTANAAAAIATTYIGTYATGAATITHANNAQTDKTFDYVIHNP